MLEIGSIVDGKYKILNKIGQGGMSVVYLAMNERANKQWAIKEIRKDGVSNYEVVKQGLIVETDLLKKLNHPHLPSIIDVIDGDGTFLIVMDYIEGNALNKILKQRGAQSQEDVIEWSKQLCDVLGYLHSRKPPIVYRDMKPSNVMLKPDGTVTLIDFGTAREFKSASVADTTCLGTQGYAAPEQFGGQGQTDGRTDIYCLGATMYHLVTGHNPAEPPYEMYPIRQWNPKLSSGLEAIILKCTQKNPNDRYQSCAELMYDLEHYKELENETKKEYKKKWRLFLTTSIMCVVSLIGTIGFKVAANNVTQSTYDYYIEKGLEDANGGDYDSAQENFENAMKLSPERPEAYIDVLTKVFLISDRNTFTIKEGDYYLKTYITEDNKELLKGYDEDKYEELAYEIGDAYCFYYENNNRLNDAKRWYDIATKSEALSSDKVNKARIMSQVIDWKLNGIYSKDGDVEVPFETIRSTLDELLALIELETNDAVIINGYSIYNDLVSVEQNQRNLLKVGMSYNEMIKAYEKIMEELNRIEQDSYDGLHDNIKLQFDNLIKSVEENLNNLEKKSNSQGSEE